MVTLLPFPDSFTILENTVTVSIKVVKVHLPLL